MICRRLVVLFALTGTILYGQDQLNKLNVVATDREGRPVTGLQPSDLLLQEDGKPRKIEHLQFTGASPSHSTVILLDLLSDRTLTGAIINEQLLRAFKNLNSSEGLYLYFLTAAGELYPIHPLPQSMDEIAATGPSWTQSVNPLLQAALQKLVAFKPVDDFDPKVRLAMTSTAIRQLGARMQVMNGRKNLVWITRGIPLTGHSEADLGPVDFTGQIRMLAETLERAQVSVYPVGAEMNSARDFALTEIADLTGGKKFAWGAVGEALDQAIADARSNYQAAFYAPAGNPDGERHKYRIASARKGVLVRTLPGYYALLSPPKQNDAEQMAIAVALHNQFDASAIALQTTASPVPDSPGIANFSIRVDPACLLLHQQGGHRTGNVLLLLAGFGPSPSANPTSLNIKLESGPYTSSGLRLDLPGTPISVNIDLNPEQYSAALANGMIIHASAPVKQNIQRIRAVVIDSALGLSGASTVPAQTLLFN